jgi:hypothetical protein
MDTAQTIYKFDQGIWSIPPKRRKLLRIVFVVAAVGVLVWGGIWAPMYAPDVTRHPNARLVNLAIWALFFALVGINRAFKGACFVELTPENLRWKADNLAPHSIKVQDIQKVVFASGSANFFLTDGTIYNIHPEYFPKRVMRELEGHLRALIGEQAEMQVV